MNTRTCIEYTYSTIFFVINSLSIMMIDLSIVLLLINKYYTY